MTKKKKQQLQLISKLKSFARNPKQCQRTKPRGPSLGAKAEAEPISPPTAFMMTVERKQHRNKIINSCSHNKGSLASSLPKKKLTDLLFSGRRWGSHFFLCCLMVIIRYVEISEQKAWLPMKKVDAKTKTEKLGLTHHNLHWWVAGRMVWRRLQLGRLGQAGPFWGRPGNLCVEVRSINIASSLSLR